MYAGLRIECLLFCPMLKLESSAQILVKLPNIKFHEKSPAGVEFFRADEQTDRQDEANIRSLQFFLRMRLKPKRKEIQQILIPKNLNYF